MEVNITVNNLEELRQVLGNSAVDKCFLEYLYTVAENTKKVNDFANNKARMTNEEMYEYIEKIGKNELYDEVQILKKAVVGRQYPRYLKAIRVSLIAQGYDPDWVEGPFRTALDKKYLA